MKPTLNFDPGVMRAHFPTNPDTWFEVVSIERYDARIWLKTPRYVVGYKFLTMAYNHDSGYWDFTYDPGQVRQVPVAQHRPDLQADWDGMLRSGYHHA